MLVVNALAGTGKTTTSIFGLGVKVPKGIVLSDEQKDIVKFMRSFEWETCATQAFNKSIAEELKKRVPPGVQAETCNAFGHRAWMSFIGKKQISVDASKCNAIFRSIAHHIPWSDRYSLEAVVCPMVRLCKNYLVDPVVEMERVQWLADRFDFELTPQVIDYVQQVYKLGLDGTKVIDYDDQIFLPIYHNIPIPKFDLVVVDEVQDLNIAKQEFAIRMTKKYMVAVGDRHQAIYGFSGADTEAMDTLAIRMKSMAKDNGVEFKELPLTITRRNPTEVVRIANKYVPSLKAASNAEKGIIDECKESELVESLVKDENSRMILCRTNAPLTSLAFRLIARKRRCYIQGKDIGTGIKTSISSFKTLPFNTAIQKAIEKVRAKIVELEKKPFPDENKIESLRDRIVCIIRLADGCESIEEFNSNVDSLFKDKGSEGDIMLSSVHKSKGLEHPHVMILKPSILPHVKLMRRNRNGTMSFQCEQEKNLAYVAYTRSQNRLTFIIEDKSLEEVDDCKEEYDSCDVEELDIYS